MNKFFKIAAVAVISFLAGVITSNVLQTKSLKLEYNSNNDDIEDSDDVNLED